MCGGGTRFLLERECWAIGMGGTLTFDEAVADVMLHRTGSGCGTDVLQHKILIEIIDRQRWKSS